MNIIQIQLYGGLALFALLAWQLSTGLRWIKLGRSRVKIHRITGITLAVVAVPHLLSGLYIAGVLRF